MIAIARIYLLFGNKARVADTCNPADKDHLLDGRLVCLPMVEEDARRTWHHEDIGIGGLKVGHTLVGIAIRVVIVHERDGISLVSGVGCKTVAVETAPLSFSDGVVDIILQGEVEGSALNLSVHLGAVNPVFHQCHIAVPILSH